MKFDVMREHEGDRMYKKGDTREVDAALVGHLVPRVLRPIDGGSGKPVDDTSTPGAGDGAQAPKAADDAQKPGGDAAAAKASADAAAADSKKAESPVQNKAQPVPINKASS